MSLKKLLLIGGGGHCRSVIDVIEKQGEYQIIGIVDLKEKIGHRILNYEIIGSDEDLPQLRSLCEHALVTIGHIYNAEPRKRLYYLLKTHGFKLPVIISPLAYVSKYSIVEEGTVVMHFAVVNSNSKIGKNCIVNSKALIEHDCEVEDHCHISTGAILNGGAKVKTGSFIGSGAVCVENTVIPENSFVKAGSLFK